MFWTPIRAYVFCGRISNQPHLKMLPAVMPNLPTYTNYNSGIELHLKLESVVTAGVALVKAKTSVAAASEGLLTAVSKEPRYSRTKIVPRVAYQMGC